MTADRTTFGAVLVVVLVGIAAGCTSAAGPGTTSASGAPSGSSASEASVPEDLAPFYTQTLRWDPCEERTGSVRCAALTVPVDYDDPTGATLDLALIRTEATGADPVGNLVVNAGGPGIALVDAAWFPGGLVSEGLRSSVHVVGFDPRGVGRSGGLDCLDPGTRAAHLALDRTPDTPAEVAALDEATKAHADACTEQGADRLPFLGTEQVVRDLDVLRAALGEERLHYLGYSYGTLLGAEYAARHPDRTGRMALVSPVPSGRLDPLDWVHDRAVNAEAALDRAFDQCLAAADCPLGEDRDDARARLLTYLGELDERPVDVDGSVLTREAAVRGIEATLGWGADGWGELGRALEAAYRGHPLLLADLAEPQDTDWLDAQQAVLCLDSPQGVRPLDAADLVEQWGAEAPVFGEPYAWLVASACLGWPTSSFEPAPRPADVQVLLVHSEGDPWSPPADAERMAEELPAAVRLTYVGAQHLSYLASPCVREAVDGYLSQGLAPGSDVCADGSG